MRAAASTALPALRTAVPAVLALLACAAVAPRAHAQQEYHAHPASPRLGGILDGSPDQHRTLPPAIYGGHRADPRPAPRPYVQAPMPVPVYRGAQPGWDGRRIQPQPVYYDRYGRPVQPAYPVVPARPYGVHGHAEAHDGTRSGTALLAGVAAGLFVGWALNR